MPEPRERETGSYYAAPLAGVGVPGVFGAKTWHHWVMTLGLGSVAAALLGFGVAHIACLLGSANLVPEVSRMVGVMLSAVGLLVGAVAGLGGVQVLARRGPAVRACREGLEVRLTGPSGIDGVPSAPKPFRLARALLTGGACRFPTVRIPWAALAGVSVTRTWLLSKLLVVRWRTEGGAEVGWVRLPQDEIAEPVEKVAAALRAWAGDEGAREALPGWGDPA